MKFRRKNQYSGNGFQVPPNGQYANQQYPNPQYPNGGYPQNNGYQNQPNYNYPQQPQTPQQQFQQTQQHNENFGPRAIRIIRKERLCHTLFFFFWFALFAAAAGSAIMFYLFSRGIIGSNIIVEYFETNVIGWYVLAGIVGFIGFIGTVWNLFQMSSWKSTAKKLKHNNRYDDSSVALRFGDVYKKQILRNVSVKWLAIATFTYYGIFIALIFGLRNVVIDVDWTNFKFFLDIGKHIRDTFGDVITFCSINLAILVSIIVLSIVYIVFNKKYILQIRDFLGPDAATIVASVEEKRISRNKALRRIFIVSVLLIIVLPVFIMGILIWRFIKRKRAK